MEAEFPSWTIFGGEIKDKSLAPTRAEPQVCAFLWGEGIGLIPAIAPPASATLWLSLAQDTWDLQLDSILPITGSPISSYQCLSLETPRAQLSLPHGTGASGTPTEGQVSFAFSAPSPTL